MYFQLFFLEFVSDVQYLRSDFSIFTMKQTQNKQVNGLKWSTSKWQKSVTKLMDFVQPGM